MKTKRIMHLDKLNKNAFLVGCILSDAVAVSGGGGSAWEGVYPGGCLPRGCLLGGLGVYTPCGQNS